LIGHSLYQKNVEPSTIWLPKVVQFKADLYNLI